MGTRQRPASSGEPAGHPFDGTPPPSPHESTARQLVVCLDGTNNTLTAGVRDTDVLQLFEILRDNSAARSDGPEQVLYYDPGVGSASALPPIGIAGFITEPLRRTAGLALGRGVYENIGQAYLHLCRHYGARETAGSTTTTDEIYLFGFSRGAFTARAVAGMVNLFGLIRPEHEVLLPTLLRVYFSGDPGAQPGAGQEASAGDAGTADASAGDAAVASRQRSESPRGQLIDDLASRAGTAGPGIGSASGATMGFAARGLQRVRVALDPVPRAVTEHLPGQTAPLSQIRRGDVAHQIRTQFTTPIGETAEVYFVGVWDTVDSVGLPGLRKRITSPATIKGKRFRHIRHAMALDEHRRQFLPRPYVGTPDPNEPDIDPGQTLKQLWFRGVHTDIGGGRPVSLTRMSSETMHWMVTEARSVGLRCPDVPVATEPLPEIIGDQLRAQPLWALTGMALRDPSTAPAGTLDPDGAALFPPDGHRVAPGPFTEAPLEHVSLAELSPAVPGGPRTTPPGSPWAGQNGPRSQAWLSPLVIAAMVAVLGWIAAGANADGGPVGWHLWGALRQGAALSWSQVTTLWWPPSASHELTRQAVADAPGQHVSYGWAMFFALWFVLAAAVGLARVVARAFGRLTMWRRARDSQPSWQPRLVGLGYPLLVVGALLQGVFVIAAWDVGDSAVRWALLGLATIASAAALAGAVLSGLLIVRWLAHEVGQSARRLTAGSQSTK